MSTTLWDEVRSASCAQRAQALSGGRNGTSPNTWLEETYVGRLSETVDEGQMMEWQTRSLVKNTREE